MTKAQTPHQNPETYEIKISFARHTPNPSRVFRTMSEMIESLEHIDRDLLFPFDARIETELLLEDIQQSSLKSVLRNIVKAVDDEALREGDWKKVVGRFLLQGKVVLLEFLADKNEITQRQQVVELEKKLTQLAADTQIKRIPSYTPIPIDVLLFDIGTIAKALSYLGPNDEGYFIAAGRNVKLNPNFVFNREAVEELLTKETRITREDVTVRVKKPDYLGHSMWDIRFHEHVIPAKIDDTVWLERFQNRIEDVRPGDSLRVTMETTVSIGFQGEVVAQHYRVTKVHGIVQLPPYEKQVEIDDGTEE